MFDAVFIHASNSLLRVNFLSGILSLGKNITKFIGDHVSSFCFSSLCMCPLFVTPGTLAHQAPLSMGCPRQEYWTGLPFPSPGDLPDPGIEPRSPALAGRFFTAETPGKPHIAQCSLFHCPTPSPCPHDILSSLEAVVSFSPTPSRVCFFSGAVLKLFTGGFHLSMS